MMARIVTQKPDPGNRVGLHYSPFQQSSPIRAPSIQLLARARSTQNRILEQPIREVGLAAPSLEGRATPPRCVIRPTDSAAGEAAMRAAAAGCRAGETSAG